MREKTLYYEDYALGHRRETFGRTLTQDDFVRHAGETGDFFPHHLDAEWCKTQPFKRPIAHGTLTFAVGVGMTAELINPVAISYGYDRLRFLRPVHAGDTIRSVVTISEKKDHKAPGFGMVTERLEVLNQRGEAVLVADHLLRVEKRPSAG